jgi:hypothetical protein
MIEYTCTWSLSDVSIWCYGAEVATHDDLECTLVLDGECRLIAVRLPVDCVTGKTIEVSNLCLKSPAYIDANAQAIWRSARRHPGQAADERAASLFRRCLRAGIRRCDVALVTRLRPGTRAAGIASELRGTPSGLFMNAGCTLHRESRGIRLSREV